MTVSQPNVTVTKLEMSAVKIKWKGPGASVFTDLGATLDNVAVEMKYSKAEIKTDQYGPGTTVDRRVTGLEVTVATSLAEIKELDLWEVVFPHVSKETVGPDEMIEFLNRCGDDDLSHAGVLVLHPLTLPDSDESMDMTFFKAVGAAESTLTWGPATQGKLPIKWNVLPDTTATGTPDGAPIWFRLGPAL